MIERFRRTGIRLDREGRFWHEGREIEHRGLRRGLLRWLDVLDDGRPILRLDALRYAYIDVEDAHLLVTSLSWDGDVARLVLNDGSEETLDPETLRVGDDHAMYCSVRGGTLEARLTRPAYYALAERIEESSGAFGLRLGDRFFVIEARQRQGQAEPSPAQG